MKCARLLIATLLVLTSLFAPLGNSDAAPNTVKKPRICLVLKGGGALGLAHVGVLKVLEANRVPIHCVTGTSIGSIVGGAYASGTTLQEMERILNTTDWDEFFGENIARETRDFRLKPGRNREIYGDAKISFKNGKLVTPSGMIQGQNIRPLFQGLFGDLPTPVEFDSLPVPFRAITADVETGEKYVPSRGDLATVVRASMSIPGAFAPVEIDGKLLVDGGIVNNLPVEDAIEMGGDVLIVVNLISELAKRDDLTSPLSLSGQMINLLLLQNSLISLTKVRPQDIVVDTNVSAFTAVQFDKGVELMKIGEDSANKMLPQLQKLSVSEQEYARYSAARTARSQTPKQIDFVRIKGEGHISQARIAQAIELKAGDQFSREVVERDIQEIYQTGYFQSVQYTLVKEGDKNGLEIEVKEKEWLDKFLRLGASIEDDFDGNDSFRLGAAYRMNTTLTRDGYGEVQFEIGKSPRLIFELYQPLGSESPYFINPLFGYTRSELNLVDDDVALAEYSRSEFFGTLNFGRRLGTTGEFLVGVTRAQGDLSREVGDPLLPEFDYDTGDFVTGFDLDALDKPDFPSKGYAFNTRYRLAEEELGADDEFGDISGGFALPWSFDRNTIGLRLDYAYTFGTRPVEQSYSLGGFGTISGFTQNSLTASDYVTGQLIAFRRFSELQNPLFNVSFFLGSTLEFTNIANDVETLEDHDLITSGSAFVGVDTPLMPLYLGFGLADTGDHSVYLALGRLGRTGKR